MKELYKQTLFDLYFKKELSFRDISEITGYSSTTIRKYFKNYGFKPRNKSEACKLRCKKKPNTNPGRPDMPKNPLFGKENPAYKRGWWINVHGYKMISYKGKEMKYHHYIWQIKNNRDIPIGYQIHHINEDKLDNRIENLICLSNSEHQKLHNQPRDKTSGRFISK